MGRVITSTTHRKAQTPKELVERFARIMRQRYGATLYLFGSRAAGTARSNSDYDVVAVSETFREHERTCRVKDRLLLWYEAGGWDTELDLHCFTPEEFREELKGGLGYLGQAQHQSQLIRMASDTPSTAE